MVVSTFAVAIEIQIKSVSPDGELDRSMVLHTQLPEKVVLDCQSFIQGLRVGEQQNATIFIMDPFECEGMQDRVKASLERSLFHCIDVDSDIRSDYTCP